LGFGLWEIQKQGFEKLIKADKSKEKAKAI